MPTEDPDRRHQHPAQLVGTVKGYGSFEHALGR